MGIKTYQEKNAKPIEKELAQSDIQVKRKIQKTIRKYHFPEENKLGLKLNFTLESKWTGLNFDFDYLTEP